MSEQLALDIENARSQFPALTDGYIYADNAGGSQCLKSVVDRISDYLLNTNVQLGKQVVLVRTYQIMMMYRLTG